LGQYTGKVNRWQNSNQILRWTAAGLMDIEPRLYKIRGHNYLKVLRLKMRQMIEPEKPEATKESVSEIPGISQAVSV
jgi:hypothetical protein